MSRNSWIVLIALSLFIAPLYVRTFLEAKDSLKSARTVRLQGAWLEAYEHYWRAMSWDSPGNSSARQAMHEFGQLLEETTDEDLKRQGLYLFIRGLQSSRSFLRLFDKEREEALKNARELLKAPESSDTIVRELNPPKVDYRFQLLAQLCFWGWVGSYLYALYRGVTPGGEILKKELFRKGILSLGFFALWLVCLRYA